MAVDHYALCPCGSGKKIKFCKCASSIDELDKVTKMVSGGQVVAAIDRINHVLGEHPDAAWALAIKGRLLLSLNEQDALMANADRFLRLQPANPLALAQKALAELTRQNFEAAATNLLQALAESGRAVDSFVLEVAMMLAHMMARVGAVLSARLFASITLAAGEHEVADMGRNILSQLNRSPEINVLLRNLPPVIERPEEVSWAERFDEADSLLRSNQVLLAESKFEGINRQFADQPAVLSGLLTCAIWRIDQKAQVRYLKKLSQAMAEEDAELAARLWAMTGAIAPLDSDFSLTWVDIELEIDSADEATVALTGSPICKPIPAESLAQVRSAEDDVPPRAGFHILSAELPTGEGGLPSYDQVPDMLCLLLVYGKQTDRSALVQISDVQEQLASTVTEQVASILQTDKTPKVTESLASYRDLMRPRFLLDEYAREADEAWLDELLQTKLINTLLSAKFKGLAGKTLGETVNDDATQLFRTALLRLLSGENDARDTTEPFSLAMAKALNVPPQETLVPKTDEELEELSAFDLKRVDPSELDVEGLMYLFQRSVQVASNATAGLAAKRIVAEDAKSPLEDKEIVLMAHTTLIQTADNADEATAMIEQAKAWCAANQLDVGGILYSELQLHLRNGNPEGFQRTIETIFREHSHNQELITHVQRLLMQLGLINPDGTPRASRQAAPQPSSAIWTGDSAGPASSLPPAGAEQQPPASGGGGGKLWVPGMD